MPNKSYPGDVTIEVAIESFRPIESGQKSSISLKLLQSRRFPVKIDGSNINIGWIGEGAAATTANTLNILLKDDRKYLILGIALVQVEGPDPRNNIGQNAFQVELRAAANAKRTKPNRVITITSVDQPEEKTVYEYTLIVQEILSGRIGFGIGFLIWPDESP